MGLAERARPRRPLRSPPRRGRHSGRGHEAPACGQCAGAATPDDYSDRANPSKACASQSARSRDPRLPRLPPSVAARPPDQVRRELLHGLLEGTSQATHADETRSEEHTSELQSLMRISYAVFCLKKKKTTEY